MMYLAVCGILSFLIGVPCGLFIFFNRPRTPVKILWTLYCFGASLWGFGIFRIFTTMDHDVALFWGRIINLNAIFIALLFFHFVVLLTNTFQKYKKILIVYYVIFTVYFLVAAIFFNYFINDVFPKLNLQFYPNAGPIYYFFPFIFFYTYIHGFVILYDAFKISSVIRRNQYKYFAISSFIGIVGASSTLFPVFNIPIFPFGVITVPFYMVSVIYIVIKHHLMDVRFVIRKGLIYTLLATLITFFYLASIFIVERMFHNVLGYQSGMGSISIIILIGILFVPFKDYVQSFVDKYFFKASYMQIVEQNDLLKQQVVRAERYQTMSALSRRIIDELRSPLTSLVGYGYHLPKKMNDPEFLKKFITVYDKELQRIQGFIQQLSDFSELKPLDLKPVNMSNLVSQLLEYLSHHLQGKNIKISKYYKEDEEILVHADAEQIKRALYIFLSNSVKCTPSNGQVWVGIENTMNDVEISIKDTGEGLSQEDLSQIFDPFFSVSKASDDTNVSLAQAQNIISHHGGKVIVDSQLNVGTEWIIQLPKPS